MQNSKKFLSALLICAVISPASVSAENVSDVYTVCGEFEQYDISLSSDNSSVDSAVTYILDKIAESQPDTIDISQFDIKYNQECFDELRIKLQNSMRFEHPELFYLSYYFNIEPDNSYSVCKTIVMDEPVAVSDEAGNITQEMPYTMDKDEIKKRQAVIDAEKEHILSLTDDDMTPLQKVLTVHDYIAANYSYDLSLESSTLDTMIMQKKGVCQGYAYLFYYIMQKLDIPCINVPSNACGHIWNKVQLDGQWYNIDITHDDPTRTNIDYSSGDKRTHFLMSDEELKNIESCQQHSAWNDEDYCPAVDDSYKSSVLRSINSFTVYKNETFYAFDENYRLCTIDFKNNALTPVDSTVSECTWFIDSGHYYYDKFSGLALYNGHIYFNTPNSVYMFNPKTNTSSLYYTYENKKDGDKAHFYGLRTADGKLYAEYSENPNKEPSLFEIPVSEQGLPCSSDIRPLTDNTIEIDFSIPDKYTDTVTTFIPQYNDKGIFIGFAEPVASESEKRQFKYFDDCKTIKAFIWDNASYKPLSESVPYTVK